MTGDARYHLAESGPKRGYAETICGLYGILYTTDEPRAAECPGCLKEAPRVPIRGLTGPRKPWHSVHRMDGRARRTR